MKRVPILILLLFLAQIVLAQNSAQYDILIKGGHVIDTKNKQLWGLQPS
jgi:hypothetical protein